MEGRGSKELELRDCRSCKLEDPSTVGRGPDTQVPMAVTQVLFGIEVSVLRA